MPQTEDARAAAEQEKAQEAGNAQLVGEGEAAKTSSQVQETTKIAKDSKASDARTANDARTASRAAAAQEKTAKTEKLWTPLFVFIVIMTLCSFVVGQGLNSGTSVYLDHLGMGATFAGILAAVFSAAAGVTRLACGPLIDRRGRVIVMGGGALLLCIGTILPVFASGPAVFTVCRILQGIGFSAATTASATAASDVLPLSRLGEGIGYYGLGQALAMSIGPALALFLVNTNPPENLYLGLSAMAALAFLFTMLCRYEKNPARLPKTASYRQRFEEHMQAERAAHAEGEMGSRAEGAAYADAAGASDSAAAANAVNAANAVAEADGPHASNASSATQNAAAEKSEAAASAPEKEGFLRRFIEPRALPGMLPMLVLSPAFGFGIFFMGLYGTSLGYQNAGLFYTVSAISMIAVRLTSKAFMDRIAPIKIMAAAVICGLLGFGMVLNASHSELLFILSGLPYGLCLGVALPLNQSVAVKNTPPERWGACNALYLLASDIGIGAASAIWGVVNDAAGFSTTIVCVLCCIVASFVVAWFSYPKEGTRKKA